MLFLLTKTSPPAPLSLVNSYLNIKVQLKFHLLYGVSRVSYPFLCVPISPSEHPLY